MSHSDPIPGVIPFGTTTLFVGSPHAGKTIELTDLAIRLRDGRRFCGHPTSRTPVGIVTTDHRWEHDQGYWFTKAGWPDIPHCSLRDRDAGTINWHHFKGNPAARMDVLRVALRRLQLPPGGLVILDVGQPFITNKINDYGEVAAGLNALSDITYYEFQLSVLATAHMGKQKEGSQYTKKHERIAGSVGLVGFTDTLLTLDGPEDTGEPYHSLELVSRRLPTEAHPLVHDPTTGLFIPYTGLLPESPTAEQDRPTQLLRLLPEDGLDRDDWYRTVQEVGIRIALNTFKRDIDKLLSRRLIVRDAWGHYRRAQTN